MATVRSRLRRDIALPEAHVQLEVQHYSTIDIVLSVMVSAIVTLGAIIGFFLKDRIHRYDAHMVSSAAEDQRLALLEQAHSAHVADDDARFQDLKDSLAKNTSTIEWIGDCMVANQLKQPFPPRP